MSNLTLKVPAIVNNIAINSIVYTPDGSGNITVPSADFSTAVKQSLGQAADRSLKVTLVAPPTDPTT